MPMMPAATLGDGFADRRKYFPVACLKNVPVFKAPQIRHPTPPPELAVVRTTRFMPRNNWVADVWRRWGEAEMNLRDLVESRVFGFVMLGRGIAEPQKQGSFCGRLQGRIYAGPQYLYPTARNASDSERRRSGGNR